MAWMICGTVPNTAFPLIEGYWRLDNGFLHSEQGGFPPLSVQRGTLALLGTALLACETLGAEPPAALLIGDIGNGDGSRNLYDHLAASLPDHSEIRGITFHYLFPDIDGHNRVLMALEERNPRPVLVADAGFMYVAKISDYADAYDLFTPDMRENWRFLPMKRHRILFIPEGFCCPRMTTFRILSNGHTGTETPRVFCSSKERSIALCKRDDSSGRYLNRRCPLWSPSVARAIS